MNIRGKQVAVTPSESGRAPESQVLLIEDDIFAVKHLLLQGIIQSITFGVILYPRRIHFLDFESNFWVCVRRLDTRRVGVRQLVVFLLSTLHEESSHRLLW